MPDPGGRCRPEAARHVTSPALGRAHYGDGVGKIHRALWGAPPMPHQALYQRLSTELLADGSWAYRVLVLSVPRQAGKTSATGPVDLHRCLIRPLARCWFTAQTRQAARDTVVEEWGPRWRRTPFGSLGVLRASQGSEGIYFRGSTDASLRVFPPEEGGLDGKANERVTADEQWKVAPTVGLALDNSIQPTFTTTGGQFAMVSTAGTASSVWLLGYLDGGRAAVAAGADHGVALIEYGITDEAAATVRALLERSDRWDKPFHDAVQLLAEHNPAYGYTLRVDALAAGVRTMLNAPDGGGVDGVLRAYGNHWSRTLTTLIPLEVWQEASGDPGPTPAGAALGVAVGVGVDDVALVAAWRDRAGRPRARVVDHLAGLATAPARVARAARERRWSARACAGAGPVLEVVDAAERRHTGCAQTLTLALERLIVHDGHPALADAVANVARRRVNDGGWAWSRAGSAGSIAALEALTVALWAYDHAPRWETPDAR